MIYDPKKHNRRSIRLQGYDYSQPGAYFVTLVTHRRACLFGEIVDGEMRLSDFGLIADECWRLIPEHFPTVELGAFVTMPNHVHGIIILHDCQHLGTTDDHGTGTIYRARTPAERFQKPTAGSIPTIIRTYKAAVTRRIGRKLNYTNIWQRNYYEHVIRTGDDHKRIHLYIESNPANWSNDDQNSEKSPLIL